MDRGDGLIGLPCERAGVATGDGNGMGGDPNGLVHSKVQSKVFIWRHVSEV